MPDAAPPHTHHRLPRIVRIIRARPRLFVSAAIGLLVIAFLPGQMWVPTRLLVGWDVGVGLYLIAALHLIATSDQKHMRRWAAIEDEGRVAIPVLTVAAALASLGAIIALLGSSHGSNRDPMQLGLATLTILLSWALIHTIFGFHYAHEYYGERGGGKQSGLNFPGNDEPDYWDFVYFSFVIGMTSQVSDVAVASKPIRRTVAAHGIVSFLFNAALLALTVNIAASAI
jgi:uncharacterized membrane protein